LHYVSGSAMALPIFFLFKKKSESAIVQHWQKNNAHCKAGWGSVKPML